MRGADTHSKLHHLGESDACRAVLLNDSRPSHSFDESLPPVRRKSGEYFRIRVSVESSNGFGHEAVDAGFCDEDRTGGHVESICCCFPGGMFETHHPPRLKCVRLDAVLDLNHGQFQNLLPVFLIEAVQKIVASGDIVQQLQDLTVATAAARSL